MISVDRARTFAEQNFPHAPERLAEKLGIDVKESPLKGCDGWCLTTGGRTVIRLSTNVSRHRRRFTLAHELGHLILGVPPVFGETYEQMIRSDSAEERRVNDLASELLMPIGIVKTTLPVLPIVAGQLRKLAKKANVSEMAAAIRVCNAVEELGLSNASVLLFDGNDKLKWHWSKTLTIDKNEMDELLEGARDADPEAFRLKQDDDVVVASILENPYFGSTTMFVQLLPEEVGQQLTTHEERCLLEKAIFKNDPKLQEKMSGYMGYLKTQVGGKTKRQVEQEFWRRWSAKLQGTAMDCDKGQEYVRLRISEWF